MKLRNSIFTVGVTLLSLGSFAETYYGGIRGTVLDPTGQAIVGATVRVKNEATNVERAEATNSTGEYVFSSLDPASYSITVVCSGFKTLAPQPGCSRRRRAACTRTPPRPPRVRRCCRRSSELQATLCW